MKNLKKKLCSILNWVRGFPFLYFTYSRTISFMHIIHNYFDHFYHGWVLDFMNCCCCTSCYHNYFSSFLLTLEAMTHFSNVNLDLNSWKILDNQCVNPRLLISICYFSFRILYMFMRYYGWSFFPFAIALSGFGIREMLIFRISWECSFLVGFWSSVELYICSLTVW